MGASVGGTPILRRQPMSYASGSHTVFHHRYHIVWITKYRYKVLEGALRERIRTIIRQVCKELGVQIVSGVLSREHIHMIVEIPPHIAVSDFVRRVKGRSSIGSRWSFPNCANDIGAVTSGPEDTSAPPAATSRTMSYFRIFVRMNLPAPAGSYSVNRSLPPLPVALKRTRSDRCGTSSTKRSLLSLYLVPNLRLQT